MSTTEARKHYSAIIVALSDLVMMPQTEKQCDDDVLPRDPVMQKVVKIREAADALLRAALAATSAPAEPSAALLCELDYAIDHGWPTESLARLAGIRQADTARLATSAPSEPAYPTLTSYPVNQACFAFADALPGSPSAFGIEGLKPAVHAAICEYLKLSHAPQPAPAVPQPSDPLILGRDLPDIHPAGQLWEDGEGRAQPERLPYVSALDPVMQAINASTSRMQEGIEKLRTDDVSDLDPELMALAEKVVGSQPEAPAEHHCQHPGFNPYEGDACPQCSTTQPFDDYAAQRLRAICGRLGLATAISSDNATLMSAQFTVLGMVRRAIDERLATTPAAEVEERRELSDAEIAGVAAAFNGKRIAGGPLGGALALFSADMNAFARAILAASKEKAS